MKSIGIVSMLGVSWKAIEELSTKVDELTARVKELENVGL
jgi:outer membrane murein-binding lipoprotein Lpp